MLEVHDQRRTLTFTTPGDNSAVHITGCRAGNIASLNGCGEEENPISVPVFELRTVRPIASRSTKFEIPASTRQKCLEESWSPCHLLLSQILQTHLQD
jgi:hypothetical protein